MSNFQCELSVTILIVILHDYLNLVNMMLQMQ